MQWRRRYHTRTCCAAAREEFLHGRRQLVHSACHANATKPTGIAGPRHTGLAPTNKCLTKNNKSGTGREATKKREARSKKACAVGSIYPRSRGTDWIAGYQQPAAWSTECIFFDRCCECATTARPTIRRLFKAADAARRSMRCHISVSLHSHLSCHNRLPLLALASRSVNYMYAIHFANATFAFANLAHASNFPSVETARNKGLAGMIDSALEVTNRGNCRARAKLGLVHR
jgi:hypothetical protein